MRISDKCIDAYRAQYPKDDCCIDECFGDVVISRESDEKSFYNPEHESDEVFMDRLKRSREAERNLFYEEWEVFEYPEDADC